MYTHIYTNIYTSEHVCVNIHVSVTVDFSVCELVSMKMHVDYESDCRHRCMQVSDSTFTLSAQDVL